ncbi:MAG: ABC transporter ATP-binding protein, partial [Clostridium paraputrificum]
MTYVKKYIPIIIIALVGAVIGSILTLIGPDKLSEMTDVITSGLMSSIDMNKIVSIGLTLVVMYVISAILSFSQGFIMSTITQKVSKNLRSDISKKINRLPMSYYNNNSTGDLLSRITNDIDTIGQALNQSLGTLISAVCLLFGSLFMMLKTNIIMTVTAVLATLIGFVLMMLIMKKSQKYFARQQEYLGKIN